MRRSFSFLIAALTAALCAVEPAGGRNQTQDALHGRDAGSAPPTSRRRTASSKNAASTSSSSSRKAPATIPPALVSGSVQIAGPTMPTVLQANDAGLDIVVFAGGAVYPLVGDILVARQGSGIQKPTDLKGKTVGVPGLGALLHFMLRRQLKANGVDPSSVKYVELGFPQAADALKIRADRRLSGAGAVHRPDPPIGRRV